MPPRTRLAAGRLRAAVAAAAAGCSPQGLCWRRHSSSGVRLLPAANRRQEEGSAVLVRADSPVRAPPPCPRAVGEPHDHRSARVKTETCEMASSDLAPELGLPSLAASLHQLHASALRSFSSLSRLTADHAVLPGKWAAPSASWPPRPSALSLPPPPPSPSITVQHRHCSSAMAVQQWHLLVSMAVLKNEYFTQAARSVGVRFTAHTASCPRMAALTSPLASRRQRSARLESKSNCAASKATSSFCTCEAQLRQWAT